MHFEESDEEKMFREAVRDLLKSMSLLCGKSMMNTLTRFLGISSRKWLTRCFGHLLYQKRVVVRVSLG